MDETVTTSNGHEILHPVDVLDAAGFRRRMEEEFGLNGETPRQRVEQLKQLSVEGVAILIEDINKSVQGSQDSLMNHEEAMKVGGKETIDLEHRYEVFLRLVEDIRSCPEDINPARVGDVLALGVVLLHPFHDGNGRTARTLGLLFRDGYDEDGFEDDYKTVIEPRDAARKRGGFMINGYIPYLPDTANQDNPDDVSRYLYGLLHEENTGAYTSCYGQAALETA